MLSELLSEKEQEIYCPVCPMRIVCYLVLSSTKLSPKTKPEWCPLIEVGEGEE